MIKLKNRANITLSRESAVLGKKAERSLKKNLIFRVQPVFRADSVVCGMTMTLQTGRNILYVLLV